jgi:hypothetical protein
VKNIFYNLKQNEPKLTTKVEFNKIVPKAKIRVDINKLLNRVKIEEKKQKKVKIAYLGTAALIVGSTFLLFI